MRRRVVYPIWTEVLGKDVVDEFAKRPLDAFDGVLLWLQKKVQ